MSVEVGQLLTGVEIGPVAHGGHFVSRHQGQVIFVRGGLDGELVDLRVTELAKRYARAEVVAVHRASPHRVVPPCPIAAECGGCDFQHVEPGYARELKRRVVAELLAHLAGYEFTEQVREVPPAPFGWRSRMRYHLDQSGRPGLLAHRSNRVVPLPPEGCRIAVGSIASPPPMPGPFGELLAVAAASGTCLVGPGTDPPEVTETADGRSYQVRADGFWQAHVGAADLLTAEVLAALGPRPTESALDLYCGVGLFAGALAAAGCRVWGIEGDRAAVALARANVPSGQFSSGDVAQRLDRLPARADLVVLDPPRSGAGERVLTGVLARRPRVVAYVACDPAALGRDLRIAERLGYEPAAVHAYDLFPTTHHVECLAILEQS